MNNVKSITPNAVADFTPSLGNYKDLQPFRYWCHKVLPMVYDDSLSYYELLCKVVDYLNKAMEDVETLHGDVTNLHTAYDELQSYVNNYFSTLDVQEEINNKLDNMASNGELYEIIRRYTDPIVNEQNEQINILKARMDTFSSLPDGSTAGDAELTDIRVGYNGIVYPSAGVAVRTQVDELNSELGDNFLNNFPVTNSFINSSNKWEESSVIKTIFIPSKDASHLFMKWIATHSMHVAFLTSNRHVVNDTPDYAAGESDRIVIAPDYSGGYYLPIPSDCEYIYLMIENSGINYTPTLFELDGYDYCSSVSERIASTNDEVNSIKNSLLETATPDYTVEDGYYYDDLGNKNALTGLCILSIDVTNLEKVEAYAYQSTVMSGLIFVDSSNNFIPDINGETYHIPTSGGYNTILLDVPKNAVKAFVSCSNSNGRTYSVNGYKLFSPSDQPHVSGYIEMPSFADVLMIPIFGQSLSVGAAATPVISTSNKYKAGIMFNGGVVEAQKAVSYFTSFETLEESSVETPASGCADKIVEQIQSEDGLSVLSGYWESHKILFVSCGEGSKTIADLTTDYYDGLKNAIQGAKNICDADGKTLAIPCWIWIQGETDQKEDTANSKSATDLATYKSALTSLQTSLNTYVKSVTGQTNDIICVCYQSGAQNIVAVSRTPSYSNTAVMGVPTAQMQLVRDNSSFVASSPVYVLDHSTAEPIHLSAIGSKMLGLYCGIASKAVMFGETSPTGLVPTTYSISGNTLTIKYKVPVPPMRIDTEWVKEVTHYGFALLNSSNTDIISSVSVFDDAVTINCTASPLNAMLFYGFNGEEWKDGRLDGSRGNICDSAKFIFDGEIGGKRYTLGNYAYSFVKLLDASGGTI